MLHSRWLSLVLLLLFSTGCKLKATAPLIIYVNRPQEGAPYRMNGEIYTSDRLRQQLSAGYADQFSKTAEEVPEGGGLIVLPEEGASFDSVMQLLQLLKECNVTAYSIHSRYKENSKTITSIVLPVHSAKLGVEHIPIDPTPPPAQPPPEQRINEIRERMGGLPRK